MQPNSVVFTITTNLFYRRASLSGKESNHFLHKWQNALPMDHGSPCVDIRLWRSRSRHLDWPERQDRYLEAESWRRTCISPRSIASLRVIVGS
eukprot:g69081.t1